MAVLVGVDSTAANDYDIGANVFGYSGFIAAASGTASQIAVRIATPYESTYFKMAIYDSGGTRLAETSSVSAASGRVDASISASISASSRYYLGIVSDGDFQPYTDATAWNANESNIGSFATPASVTPFDDENGSRPMGKLAIWAESVDAAGLGGALTDGGLLVGIVDGGLAR